MQDNAPCQRAILVRDWCSQNNLEFIEWPAYSPDMNPIENIWAWMKFRLYSDYPPAASEDELYRFFCEIWESIADEFCTRYCGDYKKRLVALQQANGMYTKYYMVGKFESKMTA